jgi:AcrR family transcriptional regulator
VALVLDPSSRDEVAARLGAAGIDVPRGSRNGWLELPPWLDIYHVDPHRFDPGRTTAALLETLDRGRRTGHVTRLIADMAWVVRYGVGSDDLVAYEAALDEVLRQRQDVVVCVYDLRVHSAHTIAGVMATHRATLVGGVLRPGHATRRSPSARERIIAAAGRRFMEAGIRGTGVDSVIEDAGVAKATFYRHFPSKDDLVVAWLRDPAARWFDPIRARAEASIRDADEAIPALFESVAEWLEAERFRGCPFLNTAFEFTDPSHPARVLVRDYLDEIAEHLRAVLARSDFLEPALLATEIQALLIGAISLAVARHTSAFALSGRAAAQQLLTCAARTTDVGAGT